MLLVCEAVLGGLPRTCVELESAHSWCTKGVGGDALPVGDGAPLFGASKVGQLDCAVREVEKVGRLDVAVHPSGRVHVLDCGQQLVQDGQEQVPLQPGPLTERMHKTHLISEAFRIATGYTRWMACSEALQGPITSARQECRCTVSPGQGMKYTVCFSQMAAGGSAHLMREWRQPCARSIRSTSHSFSGA